MSWNHRLVRISDDRILGDGKPVLAPELLVCEVYYNKEGKPDGFDPTPFLRGETIEDIEEVLDQIRECFKKPIIDENEFHLGVKNG